LDRVAQASARWTRFVKAWRELVTIPIDPRPLALPPVLALDKCPPISIITPVYNRGKFFSLAYHSILVSDYPKDRIEWIIVDDSDDPNDQPVNRIMEVINAKRLKIEYIPLKKRTPVAQKRNIGIEKASAEIILMMDDDDHYPETSFRRRVAWLTMHAWKPKIVTATTIACYDLNRGISAVNSPPLDIPLGQRVSEATLTFYKSAWVERKFTNEVQVGEGEGFIHGREEQVLEIPPQQIIVAFSHGKNVSSRRVPSDADVKPGCFWGFPKEFLEFIHGLI
jgi:glycosyltransferase involved in cell wall biosynthesis